MVRMEVIGAESAIAQYDKYIERLKLIPQLLDKAAEDVQKGSRQVAESKGLRVTGAGVAGITWAQDKGAFSRGVGWAPRPNLHLLFHEIGTYKDPPRPHMRPFARSYQGTMSKNFQDTLFRI